MSEEFSFPNLTRRQEQILALIVRAYTQTPEPVSSKYLVEVFGMSYSSATVRNEMARLEELGYITAPHTSAGRVPTAMGYRYFVRHIINHSDLPATEQSSIARRLDSLPGGLDDWMRQSATVLAHATRSASLVTAPIVETPHYKHLELISIQGRLILLVLVLQGGTVHQRMFNLADTVQQSALSEIANRFNALYADASVKEVRLKSLQLPLLEREITDLIIELMESSDQNQFRFIYRDGLSEIITTFRDGEGAQQAVRIFEERAFLNMLLGELLKPLPHEGEVQVVIAGDGKWSALSNVSMVVGRYGLPGQLSGALGVLGPTHIDYERAISVVRYIAGLMTDMLENLYNTPDAPPLPPSTPKAEDS